MPPNLMVMQYVQCVASNIPEHGGGWLEQEGVRHPYAPELPEMKNSAVSSIVEGEAFEDENSKQLHYGTGWLGMTTSENDGESQFFITTGSTDRLDGKLVIFGKVRKGMNVVRKIEKMETKSRRPVQNVVIVRCGTLPVHVPFSVEKKSAER